jgi:hypothetical protein
MKREAEEGWHEIMFKDVTEVVEVSCEELIQYLNNDLTSQELVELQQRMCPETPGAARERMERDASNRALIESIVAGAAQTMWDDEPVSPTNLQDFAVGIGAASACESDF